MDWTARFDVQQLWDNEPAVEAVLDTIVDGAIAIDDQGQIRMFNPAAERLFGYTRAEVLGKNVKMLMPSQFASKHDGYISTYLHTRERRIIGTGREVIGKRKDGDEFPMYLSVGELCIKGESGFIGIVHDMTQQKATEAALAEAEHYLKNIIDSMPSILVGVDPSARVTQWNIEAGAFTGVTARDAVGKPLGKLLPELKEVTDAVKTAISERRPVSSSRVELRRSNGVRFADIMVYPLVANCTRGAVVRMDDVTERVRIEQMMVQTEKMLSIGGIAAGMAHEINNPLGVILQGCQNMVRRLSLDLPKNRDVADSVGLDLAAFEKYAKQREIYDFLNGVRDAAARAAQIVSDMLSFSRGSASRVVPVRPQDLVEKVLRLAGHDYDLKKGYDFRRVTVVREIDPELQEIFCDRTEMEQVLLNLLKNAAQALAQRTDSAHAAPQIIIRAARDGAFVRLEVEDNGTGIAPEHESRIFEPFFTTKQVGVGTGLGLSVSFFIVTQQHGGSMHCENVPTGGAKFVIRLPYKREG